MPATKQKHIPKFKRSRWLVLYCHGKPPAKKCGYCIELCSHTATWTDCPLCGGKLHRQWHYSNNRYSLDDEYEPYPTNQRRNYPAR